MSGLPEGWEWGYDDKLQRWYYTYLPTGHVQYTFPKPGDEFPEYVPNDDPVIPPEDMLESKKQVRKTTSSGSQRLSAVYMPSTDDDSWFRPDELMYMGPGVYADPTNLEENEKPPQNAATQDSEDQKPTQDKITSQPAGSEVSQPSSGVAAPESSAAPTTSSSQPVATGFAIDLSVEVAASVEVTTVTTSQSSAHPASSCPTTSSAPPATQPTSALTDFTIDNIDWGPVTSTTAPTTSTTSAPAAPAAPQPPATATDFMISSSEIIDVASNTGSGAPAPTQSATSCPTSAPTPATSQPSAAPTGFTITNFDWGAEVSVSTALATSTTTSNTSAPAAPQPAAAATEVTITATGSGQASTAAAAVTNAEPFPPKPPSAPTAFTINAADWGPASSSVAPTQASSTPAAPAAQPPVTSAPAASTGVVITSEEWTSVALPATAPSTTSSTEPHIGQPAQTSTPPVATGSAVTSFDWPSVSNATTVAAGPGTSQPSAKPQGPSSPGLSAAPISEVSTSPAFPSLSPSPSQSISFSIASFHSVAPHVHRPDTSPHGANTQLAAIPELDSNPVLGVSTQNATQGVAPPQTVAESLHGTHHEVPMPVEVPGTVIHELPTEETAQCNAELVALPAELPGDGPQRPGYVHVINFEPVELPADAAPVRTKVGTGSKASIPDHSAQAQTARRQTLQGVQQLVGHTLQPAKQSNPPQPVFDTHSQSQSSRWEDKYMPYYPGQQTSGAPVPAINRFSMIAPPRHQAPVPGNNRHSLGGLQPWRSQSPGQFKPFQPNSGASPAWAARVPAPLRPFSTPPAQTSGAANSGQNAPNPPTVEPQAPSADFTHVPSILKPARGLHVQAQSVPERKENTTEKPSVDLAHAPSILKPAHGWQINVPTAPENRDSSPQTPANEESSRNLAHAPSILKPARGRLPGAQTPPSTKSESPARGYQAFKPYQDLQKDIEETVRMLSSTAYTMESRTSLPVEPDAGNASIPRTSSLPVSPSSPDVPAPLKINRNPPSSTRTNSLPTVASPSRPAVTSEPSVTSYSITGPAYQTAFIASPTTASAPTDPFQVKNDVQVAPTSQVQQETVHQPPLSNQPAAVVTEAQSSSYLASGNSAPLEPPGTPYFARSMSPPSTPSLARAQIDQTPQPPVRQGSLAPTQPSSNAPSASHSFQMNSETDSGFAPVHGPNHRSFKPYVPATSAAPANGAAQNFAPSTKPESIPDSRYVVSPPPPAQAPSNEPKPRSPSPLSRTSSISFTIKQQGNPQSPEIVRAQRLPGSDMVQDQEPGVRLAVSPMPSSLTNPPAVPGSTVQPYVIRPGHHPLASHPVNPSEIPGYGHSTTGNGGQTFGQELPGIAPPADQGGQDPTFQSQQQLGQPVVPLAGQGQVGSDRQQLLITDAFKQLSLAAQLPTNSSFQPRLETTTAPLPTSQSFTIFSSIPAQQPLGLLSGPSQASPPQVDYIFGSAPQQGRSQVFVNRAASQPPQPSQPSQPAQPAPLSQKNPLQEQSQSHPSSPAMKGEKSWFGKLWRSESIKKTKKLLHKDHKDKHASISGQVQQSQAQSQPVQQSQTMQQPAQGQQLGQFTQLPSQTQLQLQQPPMLHLPNPHQPIPEQQPLQQQGQQPIQFQPGLSAGQHYRVLSHVQPIQTQQPLIGPPTNQMFWRDAQGQPLQTVPQISSPSGQTVQGVYVNAQGQTVLQPQIADMIRGSEQRLRDEGAQPVQPVVTPDAQGHMSLPSQIVTLQRQMQPQLQDVQPGVTNNGPSLPAAPAGTASGPASAPAAATPVNNLTSAPIPEPSPTSTASPTPALEEARLAVAPTPAAVPPAPDPMDASAEAPAALGPSPPASASASASVPSPSPAPTAAAQAPTSEPAQPSTSNSAPKEGAPAAPTPAAAAAAAVPAKPHDPSADKWRAAISSGGYDGSGWGDDDDDYC